MQYNLCYLRNLCEAKRTFHSINNQIHDGIKNKRNDKQGF